MLVRQGTSGLPSPKAVRDDDESLGNNGNEKRRINSRWSGAGRKGSDRQRDSPYDRTTTGNENDSRARKSTQTKASFHKQIIRTDGDPILGIETSRFKDIALARLPIGKLELNPVIGAKP